MVFRSTAATAPACELFSFTACQGSSASRRASGRICFSSGASQSSGDITSSLLLESVPRLKHDTGLAVEWTIDEQYKLEEGLVKYANEHSIMRCIKIAASMPEKTVRDVALRCKWMGRKRRKQEDRIHGKNATDGKDLLVDTLFKNSIASAASVNTFSLTRNNHDQNATVLYGVTGGAVSHLLEENSQAFSQISANISSLKLEQNINLFFRTKNNLSKILNEMKEMPGIMSRMAPLPVLINEKLVNSIFPPVTQPFSPTSLMQKP